MNGPHLSAELGADCRLAASALVFDDIAMQISPVSDRCGFTTGGRSFPARFELQEVSRGLAGALSKEERRGEIALDRVILQVRSEHRAAQGGMESAIPIGYVFRLGGRTVGAVETAGAPIVHLPVGGDPAVRRAVAVAALALALYRDPAESGLDEP